MSSRKVVKVFLASPGDLTDERLAAHSVVDEFNRTWADHLGYQVDLVGWEDTVSSHGRPQSIINRELEQCELFYGMLWKRWGTPPANSGPYTSGFEEEFRISQERCNKTGRPAIKLAFKKDDSELLRDPGPELAKVIAFQDSLVAGKEVLFETFDNLTDFQDRFRRAISCYVQQLRANEKSEPKQAAAADTSMADNVAQPHVATNLLPLEGAQFLRSFIAKTESVIDDNGVTPLEVARFRLLGLIAATQGNDEQTLGVHDANIIYQGADSTTFGNKEKFGLLESGFEHLQQENTPLWHWYRELDGFKRESLPIFSVGPPVVRAGALSAMTLIGQPLNDQLRLDREAYLKSWFSEKTKTNVNIAALGYLGAWGIAADLHYVRIELDRGEYQTRSAATDAFFRILLRDSRERALEALVELQTDSLSQGVLDEIFSIPSSLELASLLRATEHRNSSVRLAATKILRERSALPTENAERLIGDTSADVRMEALLALKTAGHQFSDVEARGILVKSTNQGLFGLGDRAGKANYERLQETRLRQLSEQELNTLIEKVSPFDHAEYVARAETNYGKYGHALKAAVEDEFVAQ